MIFSKSVTGSVDEEGGLPPLDFGAPAGAQKADDLIAHASTPGAPALHPGETIYTYWDYMRKRWERNAGLRIDHLLVNDVLRKRLVAAKVDRDVRGRPGASDHAPVWIEITG